MFNLKNQQNIWGNVGYFISVTAGVFFITFTVLYAFGLVPEIFKDNEIDFSENKISNKVLNDSGYDIEPEIITKTRPDRIVIPKIGVDSMIGQPDTQNVTVLDQFLTKGAVHYPGSGTIEEGNIFLFGHSTGFRVVQNQAYKTFNNLDKLSKGDEIELTADGKVYTYKVSSVKLADEDEALVDFSDSSKKLTISTCNTFGAKQERWVVEADFYK